METVKEMKAKAGYSLTGSVKTQCCEICSSANEDMIETDKGYKKCGWWGFAFNPFKGLCEKFSPTIWPEYTIPFMKGEIDIKKHSAFKHHHREDKRQITQSGGDE